MERMAEMGSSPAVDGTEPTRRFGLFRDVLAAARSIIPKASIALDKRIAPV
jgi:hypothetical protein